MTRIGILVCDQVDEPLREVAGGDYGDMYTRFIHAVDPAVEVRTYRAVAGELPASPNECDGWIITGSRFSAYDDEPWVGDLLAFIKVLDRDQAKTVGVCFGHQAIAEALGGDVVSTGEWTVGVQTMTVDSQPWFEGGTVRLHSMHRDAVIGLPSNATVIAHGSTAEIPAYRVGDHILAFQDHPEFDAAYEGLLIEKRRHLIGAEASDIALGTLGGVTDGGQVARWILAFIQGVRISDSRDE